MKRAQETEVFVNGGVDVNDLGYGAPVGKFFVEAINTTNDTILEGMVSQNKGTPKAGIEEIKFLNLGDGSGFSVPIRKELIIGRCAGDSPQDSRVVISWDNMVSKEHCKFCVSEDGLIVMDMGSKNHTWINEIQVKDYAVVRSGDVLRVGRTSFQILY